MKYGLIGEKLGHSYSKQIHEMLTDYTYDLCPLSREEFHEFMKLKDFNAINVTIPYKCDVVPYIDELDSTAKAIGAVNTIVNKNGLLYGYNTDYDGFIYTLENNNISIKDKKVLVLGNGGAAKSVLEAITYLGASKIIIVKYKQENNAITYEEALLNHSDADIIINTSPVGMYPNTNISPIDLLPYKKLTAVIDLIYNPTKTALLIQAEELNIKAVNGLEMLVAQAKFAIEHFLGKKFENSVIENVLESLEDTINNKKI